MKKPRFPQVLFVHLENQGLKADEYWSATEREDDAIQDDGPTVVARYRLVGTRKLAKSVKEVA